MDDEEVISLAQTEFREAYNTGDVARLFSVFADSFIDMSEGVTSFYSTEAKTALRCEPRTCFATTEPTWKSLLWRSSCSVRQLITADRTGQL